jgi:beta-lactamase regulating signal transducer with metallopeptidase domain
MLGSNPLLARLAFVSIELALLSVGVALLICLLRIRAPRVRALLWLLVLAKPILGLTIGTPLPLFHLQTAQPVAAVAPVAPEPSRETALDMPVVAHSAAEGPILAPKPVVEPETPLPSQPQTTSSAPPVVVPRKPLPVGNLLVCLWLLGAIGLTGLTLHDQFQIRRIRRAGLTPPDALARRFRELAEALQIKHCPRLRLTDALQSSALAGLWRPDVLLPRWLAEEKNSQRLDWMIRHELMHLRLNDPVALVIRRLAEILFYFHPAVWWAGRKWEEAMELACDRALLQSDADARTYAEQLYRVLEGQSARRRPAPLGGGLFATRTQIGKRIAALLSDPLRSPAHLSVAALVGLALLALISLPVGLGLVHAQSTKPPTEKPVSIEVTSNPESPAIPKPESQPLPGREITDDFTFEKEISLYQQMPTADGKGNASLQWIRFARHREYWFGQRKSLNAIRVDMRVMLGLSNAKWRIELSLLDKDDKTLEQAEIIFEDHAFVSTTRYITEANVFMMLPMMDQPTTPTRYRLRLEQAPTDARANAEFCHPWPSPNRTTPLAWGKEVNGLRATIEFIPEREAYSLGEEIGVCFHIQNVSTRTISMSLPRKTQCKAVVLGAGSKDVPTSQYRIPAPLGYMEFRLGPGEETDLYNASLLFGGREMKTDESDYFYGTNVRCVSGRYLVKYLNLPDSEESQNLETGFREVIVVPASTIAQPARARNEEVRKPTERTTSLSTSSAPQTPLVWGKAVNGLRAAIEFVPERQAYSAGEWIGVCFHVQNVSTRTISCSLSRTLQCPAVVKDANGNILPASRKDFSDLTVIYSELSLAPGADVVLPNTSLRFGGGLPRPEESANAYGTAVQCGPGRYFVQFLNLPGNGTVNDFETGIREVIVVPAVAEGMHASKPNEGVRATIETNTRLPANSAPKTPLVWGKEVNGLRAALEFAPDKASYALGEPIGIYFHVQNVSTQPIPLSYFQPAEFAATVEDSNGKTRKVETVFYNGDIRLVRKILAPGQEILILNNGRVFKTPSSGITRIIRRTTEAGSPGSEFLIGSYFLCDGPGRYSVHYNLRFRTYSQLLGKAGDSPDAGRNDPQQEDWQGELETGVREVIVETDATDAQPARAPNEAVRKATEPAKSIPNSAAKTPLAWGKEVSGLRAALEFTPEKASYALAEPIGIYFHVQNVSTQTVSLTYGQAGLFVPAVEDGSGNTQKIQTFFPYGKLRLVRQVLAPGQEIVILNDGLMFKTPSSGITRGSGSHVLCDGPGRYSVHYVLRFRTLSQMSGKPGDLPDAGRNGPQQEDWQGELETGVREVAVVAATTDAKPAPGLNAAVREASTTAGRRLIGAVSRTAENPLGLSEDIEWKFFDAKRGFNIIQYGLISYCSNNHALPTKLSDLNRSHMGDLPKDPFDAGPLRVIIEPTKVILASVGPDGKWDGGKPINPADPTLAGDVVYELTMETVEQLDLLDKVFQPFLPAMRPLSERGRMRPVSTPDPKRPNIVWGPEVKGLRAALEFVPEKKSYSLGDLVGIRFHAQNVSARTRQLAFTELLQGSGFTAVDEKGKTYAAYNCYSLGSWPRLHRRVLQPGEEVVLEYGHVCLGKLANTPAPAAPADATPLDPKTETEGIAISCSVDVPPGRYFLWYDLRLPDTGGSEVLEKDDWRGTVQTGVREVMIGPLVAGVKEGSDPTASAR